VDTETGQVAVERIVAAHDVGKAINPSGVETQIEGGSVQGAGYAVWEELLAPEGVILNPSFTTYILPTALDAPRVDPVVVEETYPGGPFGAKGFAEQPLMGIAPAIANAVFDAIGVRIDDLPVSPERIRAALRGEPGRYRRSVGAAPKTAHFPAPLPAEGEPIAIAITVNGVARSTSVRPDETLAETLREQFRLTGTKVGCGKEECGACTVLLDGKPVNACLVLAFEADGRAVTTIEGLAAPDGTLDPVQQAFVDHFAVQCGFCTPGLVLATKALLAEDPHPDEATARRALAGNICRCTGYGAVLRAVRAAAERKE
jgi:carbon-monoxide dehydrogenase small subunit